jgi:hypothetical protein
MSKTFTARVISPGVIGEERFLSLTDNTTTGGSFYYLTKDEMCDDAYNNMVTQTQGKAVIVKIIDEFTVIARKV